MQMENVHVRDQPIRPPFKHTICLKIGACNNVWLATAWNPIDLVQGKVHCTRTFRICVLIRWKDCFKAEGRMRIMESRMHNGYC